MALQFQCLLLALWGVFLGTPSLGHGNNSALNSPPDKVRAVHFSLKDRADLPWQHDSPHLLLLVVLSG